MDAVLSLKDLILVVGTLAGPLEAALSDGLSFKEDFLEAQGGVLRVIVECAPRGPGCNQGYMEAEVALQEIVEVAEESCQEAVGPPLGQSSTRDQSLVSGRKLIRVPCKGALKRASSRPRPWKKGKVQKVSSLRQRILSLRTVFPAMVARSQRVI